MDQPTFIGKGWSFPPSFIKGAPNVVSMSYEDENIKENLKILFATRIGERLMEHNYGTSLMSLAFESLDAELVGSIKDTITRGILLYERRITLQKVDVDLSKSQEGLVLVQVDYIINQINDRANFVYPFHLTEGTNINL